MTSKIRLSVAQTERLQNLLKTTGKDKSEFLNGMMTMVEEHPVLIDMMERQKIANDKLDNMVKQVLLLEISGINTDSNTNLCGYTGEHTTFTDLVVCSVRDVITPHGITDDASMDTAKAALEESGIKVEIKNLPAGRFAVKAFVVYTTHGYICLI